jgi:hypothetical protein
MVRGFAKKGEKTFIFRVRLQTARRDAMAPLKAYYKELSLCLRRGTRTTQKTVLSPLYAPLRVDRKILMGS